jgi:HlyD family secretion protein
MSAIIRRTVITLALLGLVIGSAAWDLSRGDAQAATFRTAAVKRGNLVATISATGTLEPEEVVDVGAQVAGQILNFGKDKAGKSIDYGSAVEEGTVLAQIDESLYAADVASSRAQVELSKAGVQRAEADLLQFKAKMEQAQTEWDRAQKLKASQALADIEYTTYQTNLDAARANVAVGEAAIEQARGTLNQALASLQRSQRNLSYCTIKSPVKGVIIDRRVNIGQTVVSSLNAPSLFLIAKDLKRIEVWVSVNEADIGNIHPGQPVTFTVDAFPGEVFGGTVSKIRLNATMTQNVVTYTVEVVTDNSDGKLLPYLTANVQFETSRHDNVLLVPNAALRWAPEEPQIAPDARGASTPTASPLAGTSQRQTRSTATQDAEAQARSTLWTPDGSFVRPIPVRIVASDGARTEVSGKDLQEGALVVLGLQIPEPSKGGTASNTNPFTPQLGRARSSSPQQQQRGQ